ncbi:hypothetical protein, partial [Pseudomonas sp. GM79]|uniref:hypothetical protein n=1 Tax=Pseudomonas sp. GM79 TaxID=1144338 RepID=UPI0023790D67
GCRQAGNSGQHGELLHCSDTCCNPDCCAGSIDANQSVLISGLKKRPACEGRAFLFVHGF